MNTASLELCRELYELSEYEGSGFWWHELSTGWQISYPFTPGDNDVPAYDLGYILRRLPDITLETWRSGHIVIKYYTANGVARKLERRGLVTKAEADTPEDAAAKLCIELFRQNILTKEDTV